MRRWIVVVGSKRDCLCSSRQRKEKDVAEKEKGVAEKEMDVVEKKMHFHHRRCCFQHTSEQLSSRTDIHETPPVRDISK